MKKIIIFTICLIVSSYTPTTFAKRYVKLPSNSHILKVIKNTMSHDIVSADIVGFEKSHGGGSASCRKFIVDKIHIISKGKPGKVIDTFDNSYVYSVFEVNFKVKGSCELSGPAKVRNEGHRKMIQGRVPFLKGTYSVSLKSYGGYKDWHIDSKVWPPRMSEAEKERYRVNYYNQYGKGLEYSYGKDKYGDTDFDNPIVTTPGARMEAAVRQQHQENNEAQTILAIVDRNPSVRKYMESLPYQKLQSFGSTILYEIRGIKNVQRRDQVILEIMNEIENGTIASRSSRKRAKKISLARQGSPFKLSKRFRGILTQGDHANKACVSEFGSGYRLASWKDVISYYTPAKIEEIKTFQRRYFISFAGSELSKSKKYRHHFYFQRAGHQPRHTMSKDSAMSALCIKTSAVITASVQKVKVSPFRATKLVNVVAGNKHVASEACVSEFGSGFRLANWTELQEHYLFTTEADLNTFKHKYLISHIGREIGPNKGHRYAFQFKHRGPHRTLSSAAKARALCISKKPPVIRAESKQVVRPKTVHRHGGRPHHHPLPPQGKAHRHGNGAIGR